MADMVISAVAKKLVDIAGNLVVKEGSRLFRLKKDILWIEREMRYIQSYLKDVDANQWKSGGGLLTELIRDIWDLAYDAEDMIDDYFPKLESFGRKDKKGLLGWLKSAKGILLNGKTVRDFAVEIEDLKNRVEDINRLRQTYKIEENNSCSEGDTWDPRQSFPHSHGGEANVIGFDNHIKELQGILLDKDLQHRVVSIIGMAGLGKTTLSKQVYKIVQQKFVRSAWVYVSQQPKINQILQDIAVQVGLEEEKRKHNVVSNLHEFLRQERYVIVNDDIWDIKAWNALKNAIPTNSKKGSRIIITSRNKEVGLNIGGQSFLHELHPLDQENSKELFLEMITAAPNNNNGSCDLSQLMENVDEQILRKCGGVPLAIVVTVGLLLSRERTIHAWKGVLQCMGQPNEDQYSGIFDLSYKDLPYELKPCFLYFGLFSENRQISAFKLINLWIVERFIRDHGSKEAEDVGNDYLNHLIGRNMVQVVQRSFNGRVKSCRIHDILHALCIRDAKKINFFHTYGDKTTCNSAERIRRLCVRGTDFFYSISLGHQTPKLRTMLCLQVDFEKLRTKQVKDFLGDLKFLRALNVKWSGYGPWQLPNEIGNLIHLIYLRLGGGGDLELPSTISNLKNLRTLNLCGSAGKVFVPSVIWQMKELRHILFPMRVSAIKSHGDKLKKSRPIEFSLPNLQTLYRLPGDIFEADWLYKLTNLRRLVLNDPTDRMIEVLSDATPISDRLEELLISNAKNGEFLDLSRYKNLQLLVLNTRKVEFIQSKSLAPNLTELTLIQTHCQTDPMKKLGELPKLKFLNLGKDAYIGKKMVCSGEPGTFPQLEVLKIEEQKNLEELMVEAGAFPRLEVLKIEIQSCPIIFDEDREIEDGVMSKSEQTIASSAFDKDSVGEEQELQISKCQLIVEEGGMPTVKYFTVHTRARERLRAKVPERIRSIMRTTKKVEPEFTRSRVELFTLTSGNCLLLANLFSPLLSSDLIACKKEWCFLSFNLVYFGVV